MDDRVEQISLSSHFPQLDMKLCVEVDRSACSLISSLMLDVIF